jgi:hypothetical protein
VRCTAEPYRLTDVQGLAAHHFSPPTATGPITGICQVHISHTAKQPIAPAAAGHTAGTLENPVGRPILPAHISSSYHLSTLSSTTPHHFLLELFLFSFFQKPFQRHSLSNISTEESGIPHCSASLQSSRSIYSVGLNSKPLRTYI